MADKKDTESKLSNSEPLLIYVGEDKGFWQSFTKDLRAAYKQVKFKDEVLFEINSMRLQNLVIRLIAQRPKAIFFDLSKFSEEILHIVRTIVRSNAIIKPALFGLVDITTDEKFLKSGVLAGLPNIHVKTSETESMIYDLICMCFHESLEEHGFANAKLNDTVTAFMPSKIGKMTARGVLIESNFPLVKNESYMLHTYWSNNKTLPSPVMRCTDQSTTNLYYNYEYSQTLDFVFQPQVADVVPNADQLDNDEYSKMRKQLQEKGTAAFEKLTKYVEQNMTYSAPKYIKVLVVDKSQSFFMDQPKTDEYLFVLRCQPYLKFPKKELNQIRPHLIVYNMEDVAIEELEANEDIAYTYNETRSLQYIVKSIKTIDKYQPYIIVFNNMGHDTKKLQEALVYPNIISYKESIKPSLVVKMSEILKTKLEANVDAPGCFILNKDLQQTYAEYEFPITVQQCSETDLYFSTDLEIKEGTLLRVNFPTEMYITVAALPKNSKITTGYYGLVNGLGEDGRMELRKFVNSVFFRSLEEQKAVEKAEVEKLKKDAMAKKKQDEEDAKARVIAEAEEKKRVEQEEKERKELEMKQKKKAELEKQIESTKPDESEGQGE